MTVDGINGTNGISPVDYTLVERARQAYIHKDDTIIKCIFWAIIVFVAPHIANWILKYIH